MGVELKGRIGTITRIFHQTRKQFGSLQPVRADMKKRIYGLPNNKSALKPNSA